MIRRLMDRTAARLARVMWREELAGHALALSDESRRELLRIQLSSRLALAQAIWRMRPRQPAPTSIAVIPQDIDTVLARLEALHPHLYPIWKQINFATNRDEYAARPQASCSLSTNVTAPAFAGFLAPYLRGTVLDVGCGPHALPLYLKDYPAELVYGVDPLEPLEPHPFTFVRGLAESLPFPDNAFDVVVAATSLDHAFSLEQALQEVRRVIKSGGSFVVWDGFVKGSARYDPADEHATPVDAFHLFHFDEDWFEELMRKHGFVIQEKLVFDSSPCNPQPSASHFYALLAPETHHG